MNRKVRTLIFETEKTLVSSTPRLDAELLLAFALNIEPANLFFYEHEITEEQFQLFKAYIERRSKGEPVAYVIGFKDFWKSNFTVSKDTLIPRPETETIIEAILELNPNADESFEILDLGTGTGCIALSLLIEFKNSNATLVDLSISALDIAKSNANKLDLRKRCDFICSNWFEKVPQNHFKYIVSNPPYISHEEQVGPGVHEYEPHSALFAENNGLSDYLTIAKNANKYLSSDGVLLFEIGKDKENLVIEIVQTSSNGGLEYFKSWKDLSGITRVLGFRKV